MLDDYTLCVYVLVIPTAINDKNICVKKILTIR